MLRLAKKFIWVFLYHHMEKPQRTFWPTQYYFKVFSMTDACILLRINSVVTPFKQFYILMDLVNIIMLVYFDLIASFRNMFSR